MARKRGLRSRTARKQKSSRNLLVDAVVVFGIVVSLGLIAVSVALNFRMGFRSADTEFDGKLYGAGAAFGDCLKAIAPFMMSWGLRNRDVLAAASAVVLFSVCTMYSFVSSLGFAAEHRANKAGAAQIEADGYGDARSERKRLEESLAFYGPQRSTRAVEETITAKLKERVWVGGQTVGVLSQNCRLDRRSTRTACEHVAKLNVELAAAQEVERLTSELRGLADVPQTAPLTGDAQVDVLARVVHLVSDAVTKDHVGLALSILLACFVEVGSGVGLFMVTTPWRGKDPKHPSETSAPRKRLGHVDSYMLARIEPGEGMLSEKALHADYVRWCLSMTVVPYSATEFSKRFSALAAEAGIAMTTRARLAHYLHVQFGGG